MLIEQSKEGHEFVWITDEHGYKAHCGCTEAYAKSVRDVLQDMDQKYDATSFVEFIDSLKGYSETYIRFVRGNIEDKGFDVSSLSALEICILDQVREEEAVGDLRNGVNLWQWSIKMHLPPFADLRAYLEKKNVTS